MKQDERVAGDIVGKEWKMFQDVPNIGGKASCQQDPGTFRVMRASQLASWSEAGLESYLRDLEDAEASGRNLLTEKYARMMRSTSPSEYARIERLLPLVDSTALGLIEQIVAVVIEWEVDLLKKFPHVLKRGRPLLSAEDGIGVTSLETYLRGELATYSVKTLELYLANVLRQKAEGVNGSEITLSHTIRQYGFDSLEEANERLKRHG